MAHGSNPRPVPTDARRARLPAAALAPRRAVGRAEASGVVRRLRSPSACATEADEPLQVAVIRRPCTRTCAACASAAGRAAPVGRPRGPHRALDKDRVGAADLVGRTALPSAR